MKKYRIIKHPNGKFRVQYKNGFFDEWRDEFVYHEDFPSYNQLTYSEWKESTDEMDRFNNVYPTLELAQAKIDRCIARDKEYIEEGAQRKLMNKFEVIEVRKV